MVGPEMFSWGNCQYSPVSHKSSPSQCYLTSPSSWQSCPQLRKHDGHDMRWSWHGVRNCCQFQNWKTLQRERERGVNTELWEERSWQADGVEAAGVIIRCSPPVMTQSPTHCQHTCHWSPCTPSIITCPHFPHQLCVLTPRKPVLTPRSSCVSAPRSGNWLRSSTPAAGRSAGSYLTFDSLRGLLAVWRPASLPAVMPSSAHMWRRCECQSQQQPAPPHLRRSAGTN